MTPREIIGGKPSALMGMIQSRQAISTGDETTLQTMATFTDEYFQVRSVEETHETIRAEHNLS